MKTIVFYCLLFILPMGATVTSCKKGDAPETWNASLSKSEFSTINDVFRSVNKNALLQAITTKDVIGSEFLVKSTANKVASFFYEVYKIDLRGKFQNDPEGLIILGVFFAAKEKHDAITRSGTATKNGLSEEIPLVADPSASGTFDCFLTAVSTVIGITQAKELWLTITAGTATVDTAVAALALIGKRVAGVITVAIMIYEAGSCFGWWS